MFCIILLHNSLSVSEFLLDKTRYFFIAQDYINLTLIFVADFIKNRYM